MGSTDPFEHILGVDAGGMRFALTERVGRCVQATSLSPGDITRFLPPPLAR